MPEALENSSDSVGGNRMASLRLGLRIRRFKALALRYWWIIALTLALGLGIQSYRCFAQALRYISTSKMMVNGHVALPQDAAYTEDIAYFYGTQVALMKSQDTMTQAVARVRAMHPEVALDERASMDASQEPRASIFDLQVVSSNPQYAQLLLDGIMDTYLALKRGRKDQTTNGAVSAITEEISHLEAEIKEDDQKLLDFQKQNNVAFIEEQSNSAGTYLLGLNNELARLTKEHDLLTLQSRDSGPTTTEEGQHADPNAPADSAVSIIAEQNNIEKLKILRDEYGLYLKDMHPKMIALADSIEKEQKFLELLQTRSVAERTAHGKDIELQIENLKQQIIDWNKKTLDLSQRLGSYEQLKSKSTREEALYNQLASSIQNVKLDKSLDPEQISILEPASPSSALSPEYPQQLAWGIMGGLCAGFAIVYFINRLDDKISSPFDLEENVVFPIVGQIPRALVDKATNRVPLLSAKDQRHVLVESHRNVRSSLLFRASDSSKPRSILISSAVPGEGKTTLSANLAITFALSGSRILLIDADMRKGVLHSLFKAPHSPGLSDYLRQQRAWREVVQKTEFRTLDIIPRGKVPHHAGDLLLGPVVDLLLRESVQEYDLVLWDSAPLLATDDAANICSKVDSILFVVRIGHSSAHSIHSALDVLSQRSGKIFGIVVNGVDPDQPGYYDRYKYKEYYVTTAEV